MEFTCLIEHNIQKTVFNVNLKKRYDKGIEEGRPDISADEIDAMINENTQNRTG